MVTGSSTRAATILDVARLAGVSYQTVSRVLNDMPNVADKTREKVEKAIEELQYTPSVAARALVTRRSRTIGVINTGATDFGPASIANGFSVAADAANYAVTLASVADASAEAVRAAFALLMRQNVEAIVLIAVRTSAYEAIAGVDLAVPLVSIDPVGHSGFHSLSLDQYHGARRAVGHLVALGHREILHVSGPPDSLDATERARGWRDELAAHGLTARDVVCGAWTPQSGFEAGKIVVPLIRDVTAVFVANDQMALGLLHAFEDAGISVPEDISLVGFDDIPEAAHYTPPLTTMRQDFDALGRQLMDDLVGILAGGPASERERTIPALVARSSSTAPRTHPVGRNG